MTSPESLQFVAIFPTHPVSLKSTMEDIDALKNVRSASLGNYEATMGI